MSRPSTPIPIPTTPEPMTSTKKTPWINRQLSKLNSKLHKLRPSCDGKKDKNEDRTGCDAVGNDAMGREVRFSAFGDGGNGGVVGNGNGGEEGGVETNEKAKGKGKEKVGVLELHGEDEHGDALFKDFGGGEAKDEEKGNGTEKVSVDAENSAPGAISGSASGTGSGTDTADLTHTHTMAPSDGGESSGSGGRSIEGDITKNTALNSHPVAGLFRKD